MLDCRKSFGSARPHNLRIDRYQPPTQTIQAIFLGLRCDRITRRFFLTGREENHSQAEHRGQIEARLLRAFPHEPVRYSGEQACAVAASSVRIHTTAVRQPDQCLKRALDDLAGSSSSDLGDQADTAGVVVCGCLKRIHLYLVYLQ